MGENYLRKIYYNSKKSPVSYTGKKALKSQILKDRKSNEITDKKLESWLERQRSYSLHKPRRIKFPRSKIKTYHIDDLWQSDLAEVWKIAKFNKGIRYLLFVIDTFSRFLWVEPIKRKDAESVTNAFARVIARGRKPKMLHTDNDTAFKSRLFQRDIIKRNNIHFYTSKDNATKAAYV